MNGSPRIGLLSAGVWLVVCATWFSFGVFWPKRRGRWGRRGQGARMSAMSHLVWTVLFVFAGASAIASAYHYTWPDAVFPFVFFPLFVAMFIMMWRDSRSEHRHDNTV